MNTSVNVTTGYTPYEILYGRIATLPVDLISSPIEEVPIRYIMRPPQLTVREFPDLGMALRGIVTNIQINTVPDVQHYDPYISIPPNH